MEECRQHNSDAGGRPGSAAQRLNAAVFDGLTANIAVIAADGEIVATNRAWNRFAETNGAPGMAGNYLHLNYLDVCDRAAERGDADAARTARGIRAVLREGCGCFTREYRCDGPGGHRWFLMRVTPVPDGSGAAVVAHEDITDQRRAEDALRASEAKYRQLHESMMDAFVMVAVDGRILEFNESYRSMLGYDAEELRAKTYFDITPDEWHDFEKNIVRTQAYTRGYTDIYEQEYRTKDGTVFPVEIRTVLVRDEDGLPRALWGLVRDISARRRAEEAVADYSERLEEMVGERTRELQKAQEELLRTERLATLGQFAGSVGHELRNPLAVISNAVYYLQAVIQNPDEATREYLGMIAREVRNSEKIICDLLEMSRNRPAEKTFVSVRELVGGALRHQSSWEGVTVHTEMDENLTPIHVDSRQMVQVLDNLIANAVQAMPDGGCLTLTARRKGKEVLLSVADTGTGMPQELMDSIFDPLVTTKPRGIGLGLTLSRRLAELNGARLEVESEEGKGSSFTIVFPAADWT